MRWNRLLLLTLQWQSLKMLLILLLIFQSWANTNPGFP